MLMTSIKSLWSKTLSQHRRPRNLSRFASKTRLVESLEARTLMTALSPVAGLAAIVVDTAEVEPNDQPQDATVLGTLQGLNEFPGGAISSPGDVDYYQFDITTTGGTAHYVEINFSHISGDLDVKLLNDQGDVVGASSGVDNFERIPLTNLPAGTYFLQVYGFNGATNDYGLVVNAPTVQTGTISPDRFEPNNTPQTAKFLDPDTSTPDVIEPIDGLSEFSGLTITRLFNGHSEKDYFSFTTVGQGTRNDFVRIDFLNAESDLSLELLDQLGNSIGTSLTTGNREQISLQGVAPGSYTVLVTSSNDRPSSAYTLSVSGPSAVGVLPDSFEPNDTFQSNSDLGEITGQVRFDDLTIHQNFDGSVSNDFYRFTLNQDGDFRHSVGIDFIAADANLDLVLWDTNQNQLGVSLGLGNSESISLDGIPAGDYVLEVLGADGGLGTYSMTFVAPEVTAIQPDQFEDNDVIGSPTDLGVITGIKSYPQLTISRNADQTSDDDYYRFQLQTTQTAANSVSIDFIHEAGDLDIELYDANRNLIRSSRGVSNFEEISLDGLSGVFFLRVLGYANATGSYNLHFNTVDEPAADPYEPNDDFGGAYPLSLDSLTGFVQITDPTIHIQTLDQRANPDYFRFTISENAETDNYVALDFNSQLADLDFEVYSTNSEVGTDGFVGGSFGVTGHEEFSLAGLPAGDYIVHIYAYNVFSNTPLDNRGTAYTLTIQGPSKSGPSPDIYEPNDEFGAAYHFNQVAGPLSISDLSIHENIDGNANDDYYEFRINPTGTSEDYVQISFDGSSADFDLSLLDANGELVGFSGGYESTERISLAGVAAGEYFLLVHSHDGRTGAYDLDIHAPRVLSDGDRFEPNDEFGAATQLGEIQALVAISDLSIHPDVGGDSNPDFYKFSMVKPGGTGDFVRIDLAPDAGDLDLEIYSANGDLLAQSTSVTRTEYIDLSLKGVDGNPVFAAGDYFIKVFGYDPVPHDGTPGGLGSYSLTIDGPGTIGTPDRFEFNDQPGSATRLGTIEGHQTVSDLSIHQNEDGTQNEDFYAFAFERNGGITDYVQITSDANLRFDIIDSAGTTVLHYDGSLLSTKALSLDGLPAGNYLIHVYGVSSDDFGTYDLELHGPYVRGVRDRFEFNDVPGAATDLREITGFQTVSDLSIHQNFDGTLNPDYYRFTLNGDGTADQFVAINSIFADGDLDIELLGPDGQVVIGAGGRRYASSTSFDREAISLDGLTAGNYFVRVYGVDSDGVGGVTGGLGNYSLELQGTSESNIAPDRDEPNDVISAAKDLREIRGQVTRSGLTIHKDAGQRSNDDFYRFTLALPGATGDYAQIEFDHSVGDLDLELFDANNVFVASSAGISDSEFISFRGLQAGSYFLRVFGYDTNPEDAIAGGLGSYSLTLHGSDSIGIPQDRFEPNDAVALPESSAARIGELEGVGQISDLTIHDEASSGRPNDDYFQVQTTQTGRASNFVSIDIQTPGANFGLELIDANGQVVRSGDTMRQPNGFDVAIPFTFGQDLSSSIAQRESEAQIRTVALSLEGLSAGTYTVHVFGLDKAPEAEDGDGIDVGFYRLNFNAPQRSGIPADRFELNDAVASSTSLGEVVGYLPVADLTIHASADGSANPDVFRFSTTQLGTEADFVRINFYNIDGDLNLSLKNALGQVIATSESTFEDFEQITLSGIPAGTYFVTVEGAAAVGGVANLGNYNLEIHAPSLDGPGPDSYELNDSVASRADLHIVEDQLVIPGLTIHKDADGTPNDDYFRFELSQRGTGSDFVQIDFLGSVGDLDLELLDASGAVIDTSNGVSDIERVSLNNRAAGTYFVRIFGYDQVNDADGVDVGEYTLSIHGPTLGGPAADALEANDNPGNPSQLGVVEGEALYSNLSIHRSGDGHQNPDYYRFELSQNANADNFVKIDFTHAIGDLDMELLDNDGHVLPGYSSGGITDSEYISLSGLRAGSYYIHVYGYSDAVGEYQMTINGPQLSGPNPDRFETNDAIGAPANLGTITGQISIRNLTINANGDGSSNPDFFKFHLDQNGSAADFVQITSNAVVSDFDLEVLDSNNHQVGLSATRNDTERVSLQGQPAGDYFVRIFAADDTTADGTPAGLGTYSLTLHGTRKNDELSPDSYEPNDGSGHPFDLRTVTGSLALSGLTIHANGDNTPNDDWFRFDTTTRGGEDDAVAIHFDNAVGNLELELRGSDGGLISQSATGDDTERVSLSGLPSGVYFVHIFGRDQNNLDDGHIDLGAYSLSIHAPQLREGVRPDALEANDVIGNARDLREISGHQIISDLTIHENIDGSANDDFYKLQLGATGNADSFVRIDFLNSAGNLELDLYDSFGSYLGGSYSLGDSEEISFAGFAAGNYFIRVFGAANALGEYSLTVNGPIARSEITPDLYEPNDVIGHPTDLRQVVGPQVVYDLTIHEDANQVSNDDWYRFEMIGPGTASNFVGIDFLHSVGDLDIELYDNQTSQSPIRVSNSITDQERISLDGLNAGIYFLKVLGFDGDPTDGQPGGLGTYSLLFDAPRTIGEVGDRFEPNDLLTSSSQLGEIRRDVVVDELSVHRDSTGNANPDFYDFTLVSTARSGHYVELISPANQTGFDGVLDDADRHINFNLVDSSGNILRAAGSWDSLSYGEAALVIDLSGLTAGEYKLSVVGKDNTQTGQYSLHFSAPSEENHLLPDYLEPNDSIDAPYYLGAYEGGLALQGLTLHAENNTINKDFVEFATLTEGQTNDFIGIDVYAAPFGATVTLQLLNLDGAIVTSVSHTITDAELNPLTGDGFASVYLSLNNLSQGGYVLRVDGTDEVAYDINGQLPVRVVAPPTSGFDIDFNGIENLPSSVQSGLLTAAQRWEAVISGDIPDFVSSDGHLVDDILIDVVITGIDGTNNILAQAGPTEVRPSSYLPSRGVIQVDSDDLSTLQGGDGLVQVLTHEIGHALGFGTIWGIKGLVTGSGSSSPKFVGSSATSQFQILSNDPNATGVPLETTGGSGTIEAHFSESVFDTELMTGFLDSGVLPLSSVTVASLGDLGYSVDLAAADSFTLPRVGGAPIRQSLAPAVRFASVELGGGIAEITTDDVGGGSVAPAGRLYQPDNYESSEPIALRSVQQLEGLTIHEPTAWGGQGDEADDFTFVSNSLLTVGDDLIIEVVVTDSDAPLTVAVQNADGATIMSGTTNADGRLHLEKDRSQLPDGVYHIHVTGAPNQYDLAIFAGLVDIATLDLDVDRDGVFSSDTDGIAIIASLLDFSSATIQRLEGPGATRTGAEVKSAVQAMAADLTLDVDGDGLVDSSTDGLLIIAYSLGFSNLTLSRLVGPSGNVDAVRQILGQAIPTSGGAALRADSDLSVMVQTSVIEPSVVVSTNAVEPSVVVPTSAVGASVPSASPSVAALQPSVIYSQNLNALSNIEPATSGRLFEGVEQYTETEICKELVPSKISGAPEQSDHKTDVVDGSDVTLLDAAFSTIDLALDELVNL